jgi:hypothetical protein
MAAINLTGYDEGVITIVNQVISISYATFLVLPALLLNLLCLLSLLFSRNVDINIRVLIINIFVSTLLGLLVVFLSHPAEVNKTIEDTSKTCMIALSAVFQ